MSRVSASARAPYRPTLAVAAVFLAVWLIVPRLGSLGAVFGGTDEKFLEDDFVGLLTDQRQLVDSIFEMYGAIALAMIAAIFVLRWWQPLLHEPSAARPRWLGAIPFAMAGLLVVTEVLALIGASGIAVSLIVAQVVMMALVAFTEELAWRGVAIFGLRSAGANEWVVWLVSTGGFAAMHLLNASAGLDWAITLSQVGFTFFLGTACYLARRFGGLWLAVLVHFCNNSVQSIAAAGDSSMLGALDGLMTVAGILSYLALPATIVLLVLEGRRRKVAGVGTAR